MRPKHGEGSRSDKAVKSDQNVTSIHKDKAGRMYWGTLTSGLFVERRDGVISKVETIPDSKVYTIYEKGRFLFVGTSLGLYVIKDGDLSDARLFFSQ